MADFVDFLEVGVGLNDRELMTGIREAETKVDKFAKNVEKKSPELTISLNDLRFRNAVKAIKVTIKELDRQSATVAIRADTKGFLRAYAEVKLAMTAMKRAGGDLNNSFLGWAKGGISRWGEKLAAKGPFQNFMRGVAGMRVQMGLFSTTVRQAVSVLTAFGPVIEGVIGSMTSLIGTMGSALVGAAAAAGAGLAGMVATLGLVKAAITPTVNGVKAANTAYKAYQTQVAKTGQDSDKAKKKLEELNSTMAHVPESSRQAIRTWREVSASFRQMTRDSAEKGVGQVLNAGASTAKKLMPAAAKQTNRAIGTIGGAAQSAGKAIRGDEISGQIDTIMGGFNRALPSLLKGFGQLGALMTRVFAAASPAMVGLVKSFAEWATSLNNANKDSGVLGQTIDNQVGRFRNLMTLLGSVGNLLKTVFTGGAKDGDDMVVSLTNIINKWTAFLQSAQGQNKMAEFFDHAKTVAGQLGTVLTTGVAIIGRYIEATRPLSAAILSFITGVGQVIAWLQKLPMGIGPVVQLGVGFALVAQKMGLLMPILKGLSLLMRGLFTMMSASPIGLIVIGIAALVTGLILAYNHFQTFHNIVDSAFGALKNVAGTVLPIVINLVTHGVASIVSVVASNLPRIKAVFSAVWSGVKAVVQAVWPVIKQVISGALQVIRGVIQVFSSALKGDFRGMWEGIKNIFSGGIKAATAVLRGAVGVFKGIAGDIGSAIKNSIEKGLEGAVGVVTGVVNKIIDVINKIPGLPDIGHLAQGGKVTGSGATRAGGGPATATFARGGRTSSMQAAQNGGIVTSPIVMMGEEAPKHPEWVIPENPAYRDRAVALWAAAGKSIGAFAKGGRTGGGVQQFGIGGFFSGVADKVLGGAKSVISKVVMSGLEHISGMKMPPGMEGLMPFMIENALKFAKKKSGGGKMKQAAQQISGKYPYVYGGGHSGFKPSGGGFDCSGAVSYVLGKAGYIGSPMTTDGLKTWAKGGDGDLMTVGVRGSTGRSAHTMMRIGGKDSKTYFESGSGHGPLLEGAWAPPGFPIHRHSDATPGMARGGKWAPRRFARGGYTGRKVPGKAGGSWGYDAKSVPRATQSKISKLGIEAFVPESNNFVGWGLKKGGNTGNLRNLNRVFPKHSAGEPGVALSPDTVLRIAQAAGLPGRAFEQIAHGESTYQPGVVSSDGGWGLWQMTPRVWGAAAKKKLASLGGLNQMLNPLKNAQMAKYLFDSAGFGQWFGTKYLTSSARSAGEGMRGKAGPGFSGLQTNADGSAVDPQAGGLTPTQQRQKSNWQEEIGRNQKKIDALTKKKRGLPGGKKGAAARTAISNQITDIRAKNRVLQERITGLKETPTEGATSTAETAFQEAETAVQEAGTTPELKDDQAAITTLIQKAQEYRAERAKRLQTVNAMLGTKLTKGQRSKYLAEKSTITAAITKIDKSINTAKSSATEARVGARFAGGTGAAGIEANLQEAQNTTTMDDDIAALQESINYQSALAAAYSAIAPHTKGGKKFAGRAGDAKKKAAAVNKVGQLQAQLEKTQMDQAMLPLDFAMAVAGSTDTLADDVNVMNQQLALWQKALAQRTKRGDLAGMTEAQNQINSISKNIGDATKELQNQQLRASVGMDDIEYNVQLAESTTGLVDDLAAVHAEYAALLELEVGSANYGRIEEARAYRIRINNDLKRMGELQTEIEKSQADDILAPIEARRALAELTDSTADDKAVAQELLTFHEGRLAYYQSISDYAGIASEAGSVKSLRDELQQGEASRLESIRILSEARQSLYRQFGSNQVSGGLAPTGTVVNVVNNYKTMPLDPHSWSRDVGFELRSAI